MKPNPIIVALDLESAAEASALVARLGDRVDFYNEPAEMVLGLRFDETGEMPLAEWAAAFTPIDQSGTPLPPQDLPLTIALRERRPAHGDFYIRGLDRVLRHIEVTAFPLIGQAERNLGAVALFWEVPS